jgi:hypothetical protein
MTGMFHKVDFRGYRASGGFVVTYEREMTESDLKQREIVAAEQVKHATEAERKRKREAMKEEMLDRLVEKGSVTLEELQS